MNLKQMIWLALLLFSLQPKASELAYNTNYPVYLSDQSKYSFENLDLAFQKAFSTNKTVLFFIHGRGNEPKKSLVSGFFVDGGAVKKLESQYNVTVIMFNWNSKAFLNDRSEPLEQIDSATIQLNFILNKLAYYKNKYYPTAKANLIAHSMGTIVLAKTILQFGWTGTEYKQPLFDNILLSSPDVDNINENQWINSLATTSHVYITKNSRDKILIKSTDSRINTAKPLGLHGSNPNTHATEISFDELTPDESQISHEIFNKEKMLGHTDTCHLFENIISSKTNPRFYSEQPLQKKQFISLQNSINPDDECFSSQSK